MIRPAACSTRSGMRILVCSVEPPIEPLDGFRLQVRSLVRELRRDHQVRVLALGMPGQPIPAGSEIPGDEMRIVPRPPRGTVGRVIWVARAVLGRRPVGAKEVARMLRAPLAAELKAFKPDVVHVTHGQLALLGRDLMGRASVLGALDAQHLNVTAAAETARGLRRRLLRGESRRWRGMEATEFELFDRVTVVSEADRAALQSLNHKLRVEVIPNGVDTRHWAPNPDIPREPGRIVFTGVLSYPPNIRAATHLAREIFPLVRAAVPSAKLFIVGRAPGPAVSALGRLEGVTVVADAPDLRPYLWPSSVYACPMISGSGIKNKLLEGLAVGLACVGTPLATQGLSVVSGRELLVAGTAQEFAENLVRVLEDNELAGRLGEAGRAYVVDHHQWSLTASAYTQVYGQVAQGRVQAPVALAAPSWLPEWLPDWRRP